MNHAGPLRLTINDQDYSEALYAEYHESNPDQKHFAICDLDVRDGIKELTIMDYGPSSDYTTAFFRYDGETLKWIGTVEGLIWDSNILKQCIDIDGAGGLTTTMRLRVLQTWWAWVDWRLNSDGVLERVPQNVYYTTRQEYYTLSGGARTSHTLLEELYAYTESDETAARRVLPVGDEITLLGTDNNRWVLAEDGEGTKFWIFLDSEYGVYVETPGGFTYAGQVIEYLSYAD